MSEVIKKRACHLCEAICGLNIHITDGEITAIKGDPDDPLSKGHICPKAVALQDIHNDPERLRQPVQRTENGWEPIAWEDAFTLVGEKLAGVIKQHGNDAVAIYAGNPSVHNYGNMTHASQLFGPLRTKNRYSATSVDQLPHQLMGYWMFGHQLMLPIPDIDHTDYFLLLGGNPMASNGSIMTVPNFPKRLKALQARGGKMLVVDPRRTETAERACEHLFIRPGSDAAFLAAIVHVILRDGKTKLGHLESMLPTLDGLPDMFAAYSPSKVADFTGIDPASIEKIAADFCAAERAVVHGRMGCSTQIFGTLCQWLTQLINTLTGNLDAPGGAMFTQPAVDMITTQGGFGRPGNYDRHRSRVSNLPEFSGEFPAVCLAEEISTEGEGQIRALITSAGNPVLSTPSGHDLDAALPKLDFMVSLDFYINETTRHANVILPPTAALEHDHYDLIFHHFAVRNTSKYSPAVFEKPEGAMHDWEIFTASGAALCKALGHTERPAIPPHEIVDMALQAGPHGLSLEALQAQPQGVDLGPLQSCLADRIQTEDGKINLLPEHAVADLPRLAQAMNANAAELLLIGRRHVRSNNSWMHQYHRLVKGRNRCTILMHPDDASARGIADGESAEVSSDSGSIKLPIELSDEMMPGVISIPHGFGHHGNDTQVSTATATGGANVNELVPTSLIDPVSGNAAVNGVPVQLSAAR